MSRDMCVLLILLCVCVCPHSVCIRQQILQLNAPYFLPVDKTQVFYAVSLALLSVSLTITLGLIAQIPVGVSPVVGTPMDFTTPTPVGSR